MKFIQPLTLAEVAGILNVDFVGNPDEKILGINEIHRVSKGDIVFVDHPKYYEKALQSEATCVLIDQKVDCPEGKVLLISENVFDDFNKLLRYFSNENQKIHQNINLIHPESIISPNVYIGKNVQIEKNVQILPGAIIMDNTTICENSIIGPNTIIGHTAFYFKKRENIYTRLESVGSVFIDKNVEIGAGCTIDKGVTDVTRIGEGTKIDNLVQIGHDVRIGKHCLFASQVGIAGCTDIEDFVTIWGQVGCTSGVRIGEKAVVLAQSGISKSLEGNKSYFGSPAGEIKEKYREMAAIKQLPEWMKKK
ncbi:MAG: UDP-3-O-(3-hydroxymyristoyl)glucosamine N-acyltransferase [Flavobacteriia bacterium]|nr:UDP-3-O-(3-hydroxymyristoyl)glucosamine N-acyltransferase [Flavobacteriia bacterium]